MSNREIKKKLKKLYKEALLKGQINNGFRFFRTKSYSLIKYKNHEYNPYNYKPIHKYELTCFFTSCTPDAMEYDSSDDYEYIKKLVKGKPYLRKELKKSERAELKFYTLEY